MPKPCPTPVTRKITCVFYKETQEIDGEEFRYLFDLPSASFEMEQEKTQVIFRVTGVGHGFGMSQYGAVIGHRRPFQDLLL